MHAFALPGLSQMSCENDTSTPGFIILHRRWLVVCLQLVEHNAGVAGKVVVVVSVCYLVYTPLPHSYSG